jgi:hypothetical protein
MTNGPLPMMYPITTNNVFGTLITLEVVTALLTIIFGAFAAQTKRRDTNDDETFEMYYSGFAGSMWLFVIFAGMSILFYW